MDANTGKITLLKEGVAVITAVSNDGAKEDYCTVTVSGVHGPTKITLDDESKYTTTIFNDELVITTNFQVGIDNLVTDKYDGITYRLQRKTARGQVVEEVLHVITSYSIHYTKLYELKVIGLLQIFEITLTVSLSQNLISFSGIEKI